MPVFFLQIPLPAGAGEDNAAPALFLAQVKNKVTVIHKDAPHGGVPPEPVGPNDRVVTGADSKAYLEFADGGVVEIGPQSDVKVSRLEATPRSFKARFLLAFGKFKAKVKKLTSSSSSFEVQAGGVVAGVRGTVFGVDYDPASRQVSAQTFEGSIFTQAGGKEQVIEKGFSMVVGKTGIPLRSPLTGQQVNSFKDFTDVSGALEKKKEELLQQMRQKIRDKVEEGVKNNVKGQAGDEINKRLPANGQGLGGIKLGF